ncbi:MAG: hypothetical protein HGA19_17475, partial [Oscillochloris sp.]|nr:hypothetical protein [Oscillochloris sp.]
FDKALGVAKAFAAQSSDTLIIVTADHSHSVSMYGTYDTTKGPCNVDGIGVYNESKFPTFSDANGDGFPDSWSPSRTLAVGFGNHPSYRNDFLFNPKPLSPTIQDPNAPTGVTSYIPNPNRDANGVLVAGNLPSYEGTEVHSGDDVPLLASGPGARAFHGIHDNTDLFFGYVAALGITNANTSSVRNTSTSLPAPLSLGFLVIGMTTVVGASRYLRRPSIKSSSSVGRLFEHATRFGPALGAAARSFREAMSRPRR